MTGSPSHGPIVECVPNFSEGRDPGVVKRIVACMGETAGVSILGSEMDPDHNRAVITLAGPPEAVIEAAVRGVGEAARLIDLNRHRGAHPRIGAADVVPFVPLRGCTLEDCAALAWRAGDMIWERHGVPVYFYGAAARRPDRQGLENVRRGQFEGLREAARRDPARCPDVGGPDLHGTAGAVAVGARKPLVAFNVNLQSADVEVARAIARRVRASSGGLPAVKALGLELPSRGLVQVSMNLTDLDATPLHAAYDAVEREARALGVEIAGSEIIGFVPRAALEQAAAWWMRCQTFVPDRILERRLRALEPGADDRGG